MSHTSNVPPPEALAEFLAPTTRHTRRIEIYEQDARTRWVKDTKVRLKGGSVSVDQGRDERRTIELVLDNSDFELINAPGELWYDKIIKVFRGVEVHKGEKLPRILIISDRGGEEAMAETFRQVAVGAGFGDVQVNPLATTWNDIQPYDIIVGLSTATTSQISLLTQAYRAGKSVLVMDDDAERWVEGTFTTETRTATEVAPGLVDPLVTVPHPTSQGWASFTIIGTENTWAYSATEDSWTMIAAIEPESTFARVAVAEDPNLGGRAYMFFASPQYQLYDEPEFVHMLESALRWLNQVEPLHEWETQIGEFMIDRISEPGYPHEVRITGRDYTKKCMSSKFTTATQFEPGYSLESIISILASNAGISKRQLPTTAVVVGRTFYFDRGVSRWEAMKEIANAYNFDIYFDAEGYLVMSPFTDPATDSPSLYIETGKKGQIASYSKSTSDARLYNHVVVTGESSDIDIPPVFATAVNDDPASPTNRDEIGDRLYQYTSSFITTEAQAQSVADKFLAIHSLEEFELSFESLVLPWLNVGELIGFIDPNPAPDDPTVFLLSSLNLPLSLGPMSGTARRVTDTG